MAAVIVTPEALEQIEALPNVIHARVLALVVRLQAWPAVSGVKRLTGKRSGRYRLRTGDYRVQFRVDRGAVIVERVGHRDKFYE